MPVPRYPVADPENRALRKTGHSGKPDTEQGGIIMARQKMRKTLSAPGLFSLVRKRFGEVPDPARGRQFGIGDYLMAGLAMFSLKYPSLLQFDRAARSDEAVRANLKSLFGIERAPCDTAMRERLDEAGPRDLRKAHNAVLSAVQRGKGLDSFTWVDGLHVLPTGGTGCFSSPTVHCGNCCEKRHRDGRVT